MGVVYKARQVRLNRSVALKMILAGDHAGPEAALRFLAEAEAVAKLQHPNIVQIFHTDAHAGRPYFEMEYVGGGSLADRLDGTPRPPAAAARLVETLARAMAEAHRLGVVHRDLKPGNILLTTDGVPKIADFGLAKLLDVESGLTRTDSVMGSPSYMAPEQAEGKSGSIGPAADVYALGAILYEMLTGRPPFRGATVLDTLQQVKTAEPVPPSRLVPGLPRDVETIALKCLQKDPGKRYGSAAALAEDLRRFQAGEPIVARPVGSLERGWRWCRRNPVVAGLAATLALLLLAVAAGASLSALRFRDMARAMESDLYFSNIALAHHECLAEDPGRAERLIDACPTHLRGWEWDYLKRQSHTALMTIPAHDDYLFNVVYSPDGKTLATSSKGGTARIFDAATGRLIYTLRGHSPEVCWRVIYSPDGTMLASVGGDKTVKIWDAATGRSICTPGRHPDVTNDVAFSPDGRLLASAGMSGTVKLWDTKTWREIRSFSAGSHVAFSPDGRLLGSTGPHLLRIWDTAALAKEGGPVAPTVSLEGDFAMQVFSPDSRSIAVGDAQNAVVFLDVESGQKILPPPGNLQPSAEQEMTFSPDGRYFASTLHNQVMVWDARTGRLLRTFRGHTDHATFATFAPDSRRLASTSHGWDREDLGPDEPGGASRPGGPDSREPPRRRPGRGAQP